MVHNDSTIRNSCNSTETVRNMKAALCERAALLNAQHAKLNALELRIGKVRNTYNATAARRRDTL